MSFNKYLMTKNRKPLLCPFCKSKLVLGEQRKYEILADHVYDPNARVYPIRDTYVCYCEESKDSFWDAWGDFYSKSYKPHKCSTTAINSGHWESEKDREFENKMRKLPFGKLILDIIWKIELWTFKRWEVKNKAAIKY